MLAFEDVILSVLLDFEDVILSVLLDFEYVLFLLLAFEEVILSVLLAFVTHKESASESRARARLTWGQERASERARDEGEE